MFLRIIDEWWINFKQWWFIKFDGFKPALELFSSDMNNFIDSPLGVWNNND